MADTKTVLLFLLSILTGVFVAVWARSLRRWRSSDPALRVGRPTVIQMAIGAVTNFFDTLGIGSFAPTTALFRWLKIVPDERMPGTLNVGHTLPTVAQAIIFISIVEVEATTLVLSIAAAMLGAFFGASRVAKWPRRRIRFGMGIALLAAATFFGITNLGEMRGTPVVSGGEALGLSGAKLGIAVAGNFLLGILMTIGVGLYAPCLILMSLLGMNPRAAFPIMMGSCAFLMPVASARFLRAGSYSAKPALGLAIGGIPAVLVAAIIVKSLPLTTVRWLVTVVVLFTAVTLIRAGIAEVRGADTRPEEKPET